MLNKKIICCLFALSAVSPLIVNADTASTEMAQTGLTDTAITAKIKALYVQSPLIKTENISVITNKGNVILTGKIETDLQYEKAIAIAESIDGVTHVDADHLQVTASQAPLTDTYTTAKVKGTIMKEKLFGDKSVEYWPVSVETKNGIVYLTGVVDTKEQQTNIINLVDKIQGIKSVNSSITVK